ncbi:MAG: SOS response-associated peptidase [Planctomycetota bacterium]|nr:SOS response-associated peptidase [Planctomycetota bacterium]
MCGRFFLALDSLVLSEAFEIPHWDFEPRYNIAPGQEILLVKGGRRKQRSAFHARWGLVPSWSPNPNKGSSLINARSESLLEKASFRDSYYHRRCIVPAQGFYEWSKGTKSSSKNPVAVSSASGSPLAFAAIWDRWQGADGQCVTSCAIITCPADGPLAELHPRMPVILGRKGVGRWLDGAGRDDRGLSLLKACPEAWLKVHQVSPRVNSVKNDDPQCLEVIEPEPTLFS